MKRTFKLFSLLTLLVFYTTNCVGQTRSSIGSSLSQDFDKHPPFDYKIPEKLSSTDTSPGWNETGQKILLTGTVYEIDGKTPAKNTILYYYQTDNNGVYSNREDEPRNMPKNSLGQTHGHIRGWVKTGDDGKYSIYTIKPGTYPSRNEPAHIHISVREESIETPYYIDDFVFDDDALLTTKRRLKMENRGGSGVIRFVEKEGLLIGERNIILGLNIPDYNKKPTSGVVSGKNIGEDVMSFTPYHVYGPDKGTTACPICKYGWYHGILYFVGNQPNWPEIEKWLAFLERESVKRKDYLKAYFIYGKENSNQELVLEQLTQIGEKLWLKNVALTIVPSFSDRSSDVYLNKINPEVENTFIIYKRSNIIQKYIDLEPTQDNFDKVIQQLDESANEYFRLRRSNH